MAGNRINSGGRPFYPTPRTPGLVGSNFGVPGAPGVTPMPSSGIPAAYAMIAKEMLAAEVEVSRKMRWCHGCATPIPAKAVHLATRVAEGRRFIRRNYCKDCTPGIIQALVSEYNVLLTDLQADVLNIQSRGLGWPGDDFLREGQGSPLVLPPIPAVRLKLPIGDKKR